MRLVVVAAVVLSVALPVRAGYYLEHEAILPNPADLKKTIKQTLHTWHDGRRFKRESPLLGETIIIDLEKREVYGFNPQKKTYWKMPAERYQKLALVSLVVLGITVSADGQPVVPDPLFAETKQEATIEGRKAYEVKIAAQLPPGVQTSIWVSPDVPISTRQLVEQMKVSLGNPQGPAFEQLFAQWGGLRGYPVQNVTTIQTAQGMVTTSETLLTVLEKKMDKAEFEVPKGLALVRDPLTELEQRAQQPAGIGAPLKGGALPPPDPR
jgi:hypothetical protein